MFISVKSLVKGFMFIDKLKYLHAQIFDQLLLLSSFSQKKTPG